MPIDVGLAQAIEVGERVEQEVRLDLRAHDLQARFEHLLGKRYLVDPRLMHRRRGSGRPLMESVDRRDAAADDHPVQQITPESGCRDAVPIKVVERYQHDRPGEGTCEQAGNDKHRRHEARTPADRASASVSMNRMGNPMSRHSTR